MTAKLYSFLIPSRGFPVSTKVGPLARKHRLPPGKLSICNPALRSTPIMQCTPRLLTIWYFVDAFGPHRFLCCVASIASSQSSLDLLYPLILALASTSTTFSTIISTSIADLASVILRHAPLHSSLLACFLRTRLPTAMAFPQVNLAARANCSKRRLEDRRLT